MRNASRTTAAKLLASVALVGGAASVAALGTFGAFTSTTSASQDVSSGKVTLTSGAGVKGLDVAATNLVPGDTVQRTVTLTRASDSETFGSVTLTTTGSTSNVLTTDTTNGLRMNVDQCSVAWTAAGNNQTCSGTTTPIIADRAVIGTNLDLGAATTALNAAGANAYLRVTVTLPTAAGNTFQNLSNTISYTFDATQRAAQAR